MKKTYLILVSLFFIALGVALLLESSIMKGTVEEKVIEELDNPSLPKDEVEEKEEWIKVYLNHTIDYDFTNMSPDITVRNNYTFTIYNVTIRAFSHRKNVGDMKPDEIEFYGIHSEFEDRIEDFPAYIYAYGWIKNE